MFQLLVIIFGLIGFVVGYIHQNFRTTFLILAFGSCIAAVVSGLSDTSDAHSLTVRVRAQICLPDWPCWNMNPVAWQPVESDDEDEGEDAADADAEKKKKKKKKETKKNK